MEDRIKKLEQYIQEIEERNRRVEANKAWETSGFRKFIIFVITYIVAALWLWSIDDSMPLLKALVPYEPENSPGKLVYLAENTPC